ncbi:polysaccharide biosynthesis tyrosine autokinase [bacterium]|nr:polysaccharide biosynthesis tyrosine autokinase [bacterium]
MPAYEMDIHDYWRIINRRKIRIVLFVLLTVIATIFYTNMQTPIYKTSSIIKVEKRKAIATILTDIVTYSPGDTMESECANITSFNVLGKVAQQVGLVKKDTSPVEKEAIIRNLKNDVKTEVIGDTNQIKISVSSDNGEKAQTLANKIAEVYVLEHHLSKIKEAQNVKKFIEAQLKNYQRALIESERSLYEFRSKNPMFDTKKKENIDYSNQLTKVVELEKKAVELEVQLSTLLTEYTEKYPPVELIKGKIQKIRNDIDIERRKLLSKKKDASEKEIELAQLNRDITINETIYSMFKNKFEEARIMEAEKAKEIAIVEPAPLPRRPTSPKKGTNVMIGATIGVILGLIFAFVSEALDTSISTIDDMEEFLKVSVIGVVPHVESSEGKLRFWRKLFVKDKGKEPYYKKLITHFEPKSPVSEAFRIIRTNLGTLKTTKVCKTLLFTSSGLHEGKTTMLSNVGVVLAQMGKRVLLVEADLRRPILQHMFGINREPGLTNYLIGQINWRDAVQTSTDILLGKLGFDATLKTPGIENLHILTAGIIPSNPAELLQSENMKTFINESKKEFDIVLYDTPPILPVTDAVIISKLVDGVILIYQVGRTSRHAVIRAKSHLEKAEAKVLGIILNDIKIDMEIDISSYYKYRYYTSIPEEEKTNPS